MKFLHVSQLVLGCVWSSTVSNASNTGGCTDIWATSKCETKRDQNTALGKDFCGWSKPKKNCRKTCKVCGLPPEGTCRDTWRPFLCDVKASRALIRKNKTKDVFCSWKKPRQNCKAFCNTCDEVTTSTVSPTSTSKLSTTKNPATTSTSPSTNISECDATIDSATKEALKVMDELLGAVGRRNHGKALRLLQERRTRRRKKKQISQKLRGKKQNRLMSSASDIFSSPVRERIGLLLSNLSSIESRLVASSKACSSTTSTTAPTSTPVTMTTTTKQDTTTTMASTTKLTTTVTTPPSTCNCDLLCEYDELCAQGGLGCNAEGMLLCRYCGFDRYPECKQAPIIPNCDIIDADGYSCADRISWVMNTLGKSETEAHDQIRAEFPDGRCECKFTTETGRRLQANKTRMQVGRRGQANKDNKRQKKKPNRKNRKKSSKRAGGSKVTGTKTKRRREKRKNKRRRNKRAKKVSKSNKSRGKLKTKMRASDLSVSDIHDQLKASIISFKASEAACGLRSHSML